MPTLCTPFPAARLTSRHCPVFSRRPFLSACSLVVALVTLITTLPVRSMAGAAGAGKHHSVDDVTRYQDKDWVPITLPGGVDVSYQRRDIFGEWYVAIRLHNNNAYRVKIKDFALTCTHPAGGTTETLTSNGYGGQGYILKPGETVSSAPLSDDKAPCFKVAPKPEVGTLGWKISNYDLTLANEAAAKQNEEAARRQNDQAEKEQEQKKQADNAALQKLNNIQEAERRRQARDAADAIANKQAEEDRARKVSEIRENGEQRQKEIEQKYRDLRDSEKDEKIRHSRSLQQEAEENARREDETATENEASAKEYDEKAKSSNPGGKLVAVMAASEYRNKAQRARNRARDERAKVRSLEKDITDRKQQLDDEREAAEKNARDENAKSLAETASAPVTKLESPASAPSASGETDFTHGFFRFENRWGGGMLNIEHGLACGAGDAGWYSAAWSFERNADGYYRIRNRWTGDYLNEEHGLACGPILDGWFSAQWSLEPADAGFYHIKNRWTNNYLNIENGLQSTPLGKPDWWSACWALKPAP